MIRNIKRTWFEVWGTEEAQNRFLKAILVFFVSLTCTQSIGLIVLALRKPPVVAVSASESRILTIIPPKAEFFENEIKRSATNYANLHYNWEWTKIDENFKAASKYVHPDFSKKFLSANEAQLKIAKEKKLSQRLYFSEVKVDSKVRTARISGDRILIIEGLRATNPMTIEIQYDDGPRTEENPEGIYITGEKLISQN